MNVVQSVNFFEKFLTVYLYNSNSMIFRYTNTIAYTWIHVDREWNNICRIMTYEKDMNKSFKCKHIFDLILIKISKDFLEQ